MLEAGCVTNTDQYLLDELWDGEGRPGLARDEPASQPTTQVVASVVHANHSLAANMETLSSYFILRQRLIEGLISRLRGSASSEANLASNIDRSDTNIALNTETDLGRGVGASLEFPVEGI